MHWCDVLRLSVSAAFIAAWVLGQLVGESGEKRQSWDR
jgi:hypothetical protein